MGPITLFDKSFLQSLSTDESVWFDNFFYTVIVPIFYIETLADLEKTPRAGKSAEDEVGIIAIKTPQMSSAPCYFHRFLVVNDLLGAHPPMNGQIPMARARHVVLDGKVGAVIDQPPEAKAFLRWQMGQFSEVERLHARAWRASLERIDLPAIAATMKRRGINSKNCRSLEDAVLLSNGMVESMASSSAKFDSMMIVLDIPTAVRRTIKFRWKAAGRPPLSTFAPYAEHVLRVQFFFHVAIGANLVASTRASHQVDIAYLFYLPFCQVFVSTDKLHRNCAPLFLRPDQTFVWGGDLKADLTATNAAFSSLPEETKAKGIYSFAKQLPDQVQGVIRPLLQQYTPSLLQAATDSISINAEATKRVVEHVKAWESAPEVAQTVETAGMPMESLVLKRSILRQRGAWVQVRPETQDQS